MDFHHHHHHPQQQSVYAAGPPGVAAAARPWSKAEDKVFESALVVWPEGAPDRWALVAAQLPGRTPREAWEHYEALVADVDLIERGAVHAPTSWDDDDDALAASPREEGGRGRAGRAGGNRARREERRQGIPWSEEEHRQFLRGLEKYGKGDWRNISRFAVRTRTPTQVASHAQKYYNRQLNPARRDSKRKSIHDITTP